MAATNVLFDPGRLTNSYLYDPRTKDNAGNLLVNQKTKEPSPRYEAIVAIPKKPGEQAWWQTAWGQQVYQIGAAAFPNSVNSPLFSWKVWDGDSQQPNSSGKRPCDNENWRSCWIVKFSSGIAPRLYRMQNGQAVAAPEPNAIKPGYWVQISGSVDGNGQVQKPGVYINCGMVALLAFDTEILQGPDPNEVGFGKGWTPPPTASTAPVGAPVHALPGTPAPPTPAVGVPQAVAPGVPMPGGIGVPQAVAPGMQPPPVHLAPNPAFLQGPAGVAPAVQMPPAVPMPGVPSAPAVPAAPQHVMTAKAGGASYQDFIAKGWNDAALIAQGFMVA